MTRKSLKIIYCSVCKKWISDTYVTRHIESKMHHAKKLFKLQTLKKTKPLRNKTRKQSKTKTVRESTTLENNSTTQSQCNDAPSSNPETVTQTNPNNNNQVYETSQPFTYELPQNPLGIPDIYDMYTCPEMYADDNANTFPIQIKEEPSSHDDQFTIDVVNDIFRPSHSYENHTDALSLNQCSVCNPDAYMFY